MTDETRSLSPPVATLMQHLTQVGGTVRFDEGAVAQAAETFKETEAVAREALAVELVACAIRLQRVAGSAGDAGIAQLAALVEQLLGEDAAAGMFHSAGLSSRAAARFLGADPTPRAPMLFEEAPKSGFVPPPRIFR